MCLRSGAPEQFLAVVNNSIPVTIKNQPCVVPSDALLGEEMRADEKEVAEHVMLVDLGRNDLGRVADYGSVEVTDLMIAEGYSHEMHLV